MPMTMRVSLPGYDCLTDGTIDHYSIYADSDNILIKEKSRGTIGVPDGTRGTVTHNLGYIPFFLAYTEVSAGRYRLTTFASYPFGGWSAYTDSNELTVINESGDGTAVRYYVFYDNIQEL